MEENERLVIKSFIRRLEEQDILLDEAIEQNVFHVSDSYQHTIRNLFDDVYRYRQGAITSFREDADARGLRSQVRDARARLVGRLEQLDDAERPQKILERAAETALSNLPSPDRRKVFVVFGRNHKAKNALFQFLQSIGLNPIEWPSVVASAKESSPYVGHALIESIKTATAAVVLLTGDDVARLGTTYLKSSDSEEERHLTPQPRPNVFFEAGMAFTHFPTRTVVVSIGRTRKFTDILGRHIIHLSDFASRQELAETLQRSDCAVEIQGRTIWHDAGDFSAADQPPDDVGASGLKIVRRSASPETTANYKPKIYVDIRNEYENAVEIRHAEWEMLPKGVIVRYGPSSFQLKIGHVWCPEKEGVDRVHVPPGELFRLWMQPTDDFEFKDLERRCLTEGQIAILSLQVNGTRIKIPV